MQYTYAQRRRRERALLRRGMRPQDAAETVTRENEILRLLRHAATDAINGNVDAAIALGVSITYFQAHLIDALRCAKRSRVRVRRVVRS